MIDIEYHVTTCPARLREGRRLADRFGAGLTVDYAQRGPWPPSRHFWGSLESDYGLLLQDDCAPAPNFRSHVQRIVSAQPDQIISLYRGWECADPPKPGGFVGSDVRCNGPAIIMPRRTARAFVDWCDRHVDPKYRSYDSRLMLFARYTDRLILFTEPSVVQHRPWPSTLGHTCGQAKSFDPQLPRGLAWSGNVSSYVLNPNTILTGERYVTL